MRPWMDEWNTILRTVIFPDPELKSLMKIPDGTKITDFIKNYFIRAGYTNELLTNQECRIIYSDVQGWGTNVPNVMRRMITFDIYVKTSQMYNIGDDRLLSRTQLIAERLHTLLTSKRYVGNTGYRFWPAGDWDLGTRTIGYSRYSIAFNYMKVY